MGVTARLNWIFCPCLRSGSKLSPSSPSSVPRAHTAQTLYLLWSISLYKVRINLLGFRGNLGGGFGFLEVLAGQPELHILLTELRLQKCPKSCQALWGKCIKGGGRRTERAVQFMCVRAHTLMYLYIL